MNFEGTSAYAMTKKKQRKNGQRYPGYCKNIESFIFTDKLFSQLFT